MITSGNLCATTASSYTRRTRDRTVSGRANYAISNPKYCAPQHLRQFYTTLSENSLSITIFGRSRVKLRFRQELFTRRDNWQYTQDAASIIFARTSASANDPRGTSGKLYRVSLHSEGEQAALRLCNIFTTNPQPSCRIYLAVFRAITLTKAMQRHPGSKTSAKTQWMTDPPRLEMVAGSAEFANHVAK